MQTRRSGLSNLKVLALHRFHETDNIGDLASSPCLYFDYDARFFDSKRAKFEPIPDADVYIIGGGALVANARRLPFNGINIAWGIGETIHPLSRGLRYETMLKPPNSLATFDLIGYRDYGIKGTDWVPCASCMSPLFDKEYEIKHDKVFYFNTGFELPPSDGPVLTNTVSLEEAIQFIGSASVLYTNSYHGAYWATLLGRAAVIINPYSSKFYQFRHQPDGVTRFPNALTECRAANITFNDKVQELISNG